MSAGCFTVKVSKEHADMGDDALYQKEFPVHGGDFDKAGEVSTQIKAILKAAGIPDDLIRRVVIACYEAEMNVVIHADSGNIRFLLTPTNIQIYIRDRGPGIEDIEQAMKEGFSTASDEMREMGFGAGMGLPNIKKSSDGFEITSTVGEGTELKIVIEHNQS